MTRVAVIMGGWSSERPVSLSSGKGMAEAARKAGFDVVEIDVGDFPIHGGSSAAWQAEHEDKAAQRLFGLLPSPQGDEFLALWREFEQAESEDARFAKALDRFQPLPINVFTGGGTWTENGVSREQVLARYGPVIQRGAPKLWDVCERWVAAHFAGRA